jgi:hypothetical protein
MQHRQAQIRIYPASLPGYILHFFPFLNDNWTVTNGLGLGLDHQTAGLTAFNSVAVGAFQLSHGPFYVGTLK